MVNQIYPPELQLNEANTKTKAPVLDLHLTTANGFVSSKIYNLILQIFRFWMVT